MSPSRRGMGQRRRGRRSVQGRGRRRLGRVGSWWDGPAQVRPSVPLPPIDEGKPPRSLGASRRDSLLASLSNSPVRSRRPVIQPGPPPRPSTHRPGKADPSSWLSWPSLLFCPPSVPDPFSGDLWGGARLRSRLVHASPPLSAPFPAPWSISKLFRPCSVLRKASVMVRGWAGRPSLLSAVRDAQRGLSGREAAAKTRERRASG